MTFLPLNQALLIVGGRNDKECKNMSTPFLDDIHLFLLDQKAWVSVKYTPFSQRLYRLGNHSMATMSDSDRYEKTVVFGGITHKKFEPNNRVLPNKNENTHKESKTSRRTVSPKASDTEEELRAGEDGQESSHLSNDLYALEIR